MNLYMVTFDGQHDYVEAADFATAIELWRAKLIDAHMPGDFEPDVQPESVVLVHDEPVVRQVDVLALSRRQAVLKHADGHGCVTGDCPHESTADCTAALVKWVGEMAAVARGEQEP